GHDPPFCHAFAVITRLRTIPRHEATAVEIDQHRKPFVCRFRRCPDVEVQAVFTHPLAPEVHITEDAGLHALWAETIRGPHPVPVRYGLRWPPPKVAYRRRSIGNPLERTNSARQDSTFDSSVCRLYNL